MAAGEVVIQSMWSPAVAAVRVKQIPCTYAPVNFKDGKEGYRGWCNGMGLMKHLTGKKLDAAYEYMNWYMSGWQGAFVSRYGYYSPVPSTAKKFMTPAEYTFWYEGKPAPEPVTDPYGVPMETAGTVRDGGSFVERVTNISCWNTLMDESAYMNNAGTTSRSPKSGRHQQPASRPFGRPAEFWMSPRECSWLFPDR